MKKISQTALAALLMAITSLAGATEAGKKLSLAMEIKEGETVVGTPTLSVIAGERVSIRVGSLVSSASAKGNVKHDWEVDVVPTLTALDTVLTSLKVKFSETAVSGVTKTRSVALETKQQLGEAVLVQIPGASGEPPLSLTVKANIFTQ